jgi:hypothetical protein
MDTPKTDALAVVPAATITAPAPRTWTHEQMKGLVGKRAPYLTDAQHDALATDALARINAPWTKFPVPASIAIETSLRAMKKS